VGSEAPSVVGAGDRERHATAHGGNRRRCTSDERSRLVEEVRASLTDGLQALHACS